MRILVGCLLIALVPLQYQLWVSEEGIREVWQLAAAVGLQQDENDALRQRNGQLKAEVLDLKQGLTALEERARHDLGMVGARETFFQVVDVDDLPPVRGPAPPATLRAAARP